MSAITNRKVTMGLCEVCDNPIETEVYLMGGNILMCSAHRDEEQAVTNAIFVVNESRRRDSLIEVRQDIWNAATVPFVELQAAIDNNPEIPVNQKAYAFLEEATLRFKKMSEVILDEDKKQVARKNERDSWRTQIQEFAGKQQATIREKYKNFDIQYQPVVKTVKPHKASSSSSSSTVKELCSIKASDEASAKYGVAAVAIRQMSRNHGGDADKAGQYLAGLLGKLKGTSN